MCQNLENELRHYFPNWAFDTIRNFAVKYKKLGLSNPDYGKNLPM